MFALRRISSAMLGVAALLVAPAARADTDPGQPCKADVKKLCPGVKAGHGAILACLEKQADKVSAACKESVEAKAQAIYDACKLDKDKFCASVEAGEGRILQCLGKNETQLSADCKAVWGKAKAAKTKAAAH